LFPFVSLAVPGTEREQQRGVPISSFRPIIFGEALFDFFPDGSRVLGGAPFNVAWHLRGFKANPLLVSRVGRDELGEEILNRMGSWDMDRSGMQVDPSRPTGRVTAALSGGEPEFRIEPRQAYDFIALPDLPPRGALEPAQILYHGTLGIRGPEAMEALGRLRDLLERPRLVDVNLRDPWWTRERVAWCLEGVEWAKLNQEEVSVLTRRPLGTPEALLEAARFLRDRHSIGNLLVTRGEQGAVALGAGEGRVVWQEAAPVSRVVDTVGAGDGFSAVLAVGIFRGWTLEETLTRAVDFAADLCGIRGATTEDEGLYEEHRRRWSHAGRS
jgi:fructokinase